MAQGRIEIDQDRCKGCVLCQLACPPDLIQMAEQCNHKGYRPAQLIDPHHKCTGCALCAVVCPDACITVYRHIPPPRSRKEAPL